MLTRDTHAGGLSYRAILRVHHNPPGQTPKVRVLGVRARVESGEVVPVSNLDVAVNRDLFVGRSAASGEPATAKTP